MGLLTKKDIISNSTQDTMSIAGSLISAADLKKPFIIALYGDLGSGKTCFVKGIALALNIMQPITSPTFTIINEYKGDTPLYHIDLYRLRSEEEAINLGFEQYLEATGVIAVEWAENAASLFPAETIQIYLNTTTNPNNRRISIISNE